MIHPNVKEPNSAPKVFSAGSGNPAAESEILKSIEVAYENSPFPELPQIIKQCDARDVFKVQMNAEDKFVKNFKKWFGAGRNIVIGEVADGFAEDPDVGRLGEVLPYIKLLIIGKGEAEKLTGMSISTNEDAESSANFFIESGVKGVLIKNTGSSPKYCEDLYCGGGKSYIIASNRISDASQTGKSNALAAAIGGGLSSGLGMADSMVMARAVSQSRIRLGGSFSRSSTFPVEPADFPWISDSFQTEPELHHFPGLGNDGPELYPIVDSYEWIKRLLPLGIKTIQLRIKNLQGDELESEIQKSVALAWEKGARLFINDFWELAIKHRAYGVHLGMEDLTSADMNEIWNAGTRLGLSTHCYFEAAIAHRYRPSYIALGPVYFTKLKAMDFPPQGTEVLKLWRKLFDYPLVAIGGITLDKAGEILPCKPELISVVRDVTQSEDPEERVEEWKRAINRS